MENKKYLVVSIFIFIIVTSVSVGVNYIYTKSFLKGMWFGSAVSAGIIGYIVTYLGCKERKESKKESFTTSLLIGIFVSMFSIIPGVGFACVFTFIFVLSIDNIENKNQ